MDLLTGESIIWQGRQSWRSQVSFDLQWGLVALVPFLIWVVAKLAGQDWSATIFVSITIVLLVAVFFVGWFRRLGVLYTITDRRIVERQGILRRDERSAHIDRVQNVNVRQGVVERILGIGTVEIETAGNDEADIYMRGVSDPIGIRQQMDQQYRPQGSGGI